MEKISQQIIGALEIHIRLDRDLLGKLPENVSREIQERLGLERLGTVIGGSGVITLVDSSDWPVSHSIWINPVETARGGAGGRTPPMGIGLQQRPRKPVNGP